MANTQVDFKKADEFKELCRQTPHIIAGKVSQVGDYQVIDKYFSKGPGGSRCKAVLFKKGDEFVIAYAGTDFSSPKEIWTNVSMVMQRTPKQFTEAEDFTRTMMQKHNIPPEKLTAIGHSEGASEAVHTKGTLNLKEVYTFNGYIPQISKYDSRNLDNIYNFRTEGDIVSKAGKTIGEDYFVPTIGSQNGIKHCHQLENMGSCQQSRTLEQVKQTNPNFRSKYGEGILKSYEIGDIPKEYYALFDNDINERVRNNAIVKEEKPVIMNANQSAHNQTGHATSAGGGCAGTYHVSGYTRNGVQVSDYYRTCGATHRNS